MPDSSPFPEGFLWGASTSSYQIEGGNERSALWDWEEHMGWERSGAAAGSWERFGDDLGCLKALGANAYRFSVEWSRLETEPGRFDREALDRYVGWARLLRKEGIRPIVCFHHFSEPSWLIHERPRGWRDHGMVERFVDFVDWASEPLSAAVEDWLVFNEPNVFMVGAYGAGIFPPGRRLLLGRARELRDTVGASLADAHNRAYELLKRRQPAARVGVAQNVADLEPAGPGDEEAVERWDRFMHRDFLDRTRERLDFIGINYYTRIFVKKSWAPLLPLGVLPGYAELERELGPLFRLLGGRRGQGPRTAMGWEIAPEGLERVVLKLWRRYQKPIWITENGLAPVVGGVTREQFLRAHLAALAGAIAQGADVRAYLHWSLLDNYEWGSTKPRFGLFDRERRPADGAAAFAEFARAGSAA